MILTAVLPLLLLSSSSAQSVGTGAGDRALIDVRVGGARAPDRGDDLQPATQHALPPRTSASLIRPATQPAGDRGAAIPPRSASPPSLDLLRLVASFAIVLALIFGLRYVARRFFNLSSLSTSAGPVQVLHRTPIAPKQHLMLIQVGRRILLVANAGAQMNTLCEITDPDEIATLTLPAPSKAAPANPFAAWFGKANATFESAAPDPAPPDEEPKQPVTRDDVNALLEKVRGLSRSFRQT